MKITKISILAIAIAGIITSTSCKESTDVKKTDKTEKTDKNEKVTESKEWTEGQRQEFMAGCISSAKASFAQRGQGEPDLALITKICTCTGQEIEAKYGYNETSTLPQEEIKNFVIEATKKCSSAAE